MAGTWRLGTASMVVATAWTLAGRVAEAQVAPLPLSVEIHDYAAVPPPVVERAKGVAATTYGRIGVSVKWLQTSQVGAELPTNPVAGGGAEPRLAALPLVVLIHDSAALPPPMLERAIGVATKIYGRIGVSLTWLAGPPVAGAVPTNPAACPDSPTPLILLRLLGRSPNQRRPSGDLGFAGSGGTVASVLVERIKYVAKSRGQDVGSLLGVVMAHEIGHLLLPPDSHASGIMAPEIDLFLIERVEPSFDRRQASLIRERIASMPRTELGTCRGEVRAVPQLDVTQSRQAQVDLTDQRGGLKRLGRWGSRSGVSACNAVSSPVPQACSKAVTW